MIRKLTAVSAALGALLFGSTAFADIAPTPLAGPSVAGLLGLGTDSLNFGLGVRGGYTWGPGSSLPQNLYIGGTFLYHFGTSSDATINGTTYSSSVHFFYIGPEGGYDIPAGPVVVRPYGGIGILSATASNNAPSATVGGVTVGGSSSTSTTHVAFWPGCTVLYPLTENWAIGGDGRFVIVSDYNSFSAFFTGQYKF
jgi:hypothetical protein